MIGDDYGVRWMTNYQLSSSPPSASRTDRLIAGMLPESKLLPPGTYGFNSPYVSRFTGMMIEPPPLLPALLPDIRLAGGRVVERRRAAGRERVCQDGETSGGAVSLKKKHKQNKDLKKQE